MNLGVKISTSNPLLGREFREAMDFWSQVLDMRWHEDASATCAVQLVDGTPSILNRTIVARSQFTEWDNFQGWIAFNPHAPLTREEMFLTAVHEIGHMFGLKHNPSSRSVMYYLDLEGSEVLDSARSLSARQPAPAAGEFGGRDRLPSRLNRVAPLQWEAIAISSC